MTASAHFISCTQLTGVFLPNTKTTRIDHSISQDSSRINQTIFTSPCLSNFSMFHYARLTATATERSKRRSRFKVRRLERLIGDSRLSCSQYSCEMLYLSHSNRIFFIKFHHYAKTNWQSK